MFFFILFFLKILIYIFFSQLHHPSQRVFGLFDLKFVLVSFRLKNESKNKQTNNKNEKKNKKRKSFFNQNNTQNNVNESNKNDRSSKPPVNFVYPCCRRLFISFVEFVSPYPVYHHSVKCLQHRQCKYNDTNHFVDDNFNKTQSCDVKSTNKSRHNTIIFYFLFLFLFLLLFFIFLFFYFFIFLFFFIFYFFILFFYFLFFLP